MSSFRRLAFLLVFALPAAPVALAQSSSSSAPTPAPSQAGAQASPAPSFAGETQGEAIVQARIRQRREQRRAAAIREAFDRRWQTYLDMGYLRFQPGPGIVSGQPLQRLTFYGWETGLIRFKNERLGYMIDGRGYDGTAFVGLNPYSQGQFTRPEVSMYNVMGGPIYRFYLQPKYSVAGRVLAGWAYGNFSGDTNGIKPSMLGLYADGSTYAVSASIVGEYNLTSNVGFKLAPEYLITGFGSSAQYSRGFTLGIVYRYGKR